MKKLYEYGAVAIIVALMTYGFIWYNQPPDNPAGITVEATPAPEVKQEEKIEIKPAVLKVYKPAIKTKLKMPATVVNDPNQYVIASSKSANDERQHTFTAVVNTQTGEAAMFDRVEPSPWIAVNTKTEVGIYGGYKTGEPAIRILARQELLQVKAMHVGAIASADMMRSGTDSFIGIGMWARW